MRGSGKPSPGEDGGSSSSFSTQTCWPRQVSWGSHTHECACTSPTHNPLHREVSTRHCQRCPGHSEDEQAGRAWEHPKRTSGLEVGTCFKAPAPLTPKLKPEGAVGGGCAVGVRGSGGRPLTFITAAAAEAGRLHPLHLSAAEDGARHIPPNLVGILEIRPRGRCSDPLPAVTEALPVPTPRGRLQAPLPECASLGAPEIPRAPRASPRAYLPPPPAAAPLRPC